MPGWDAANPEISSSHSHHPENRSRVTRNPARRRELAGNGLRRLEHREQVPDFLLDFLLGGGGLRDGAAQCRAKSLSQTVGGGLDRAFGESVAAAISS
jgi:hypothetical protein